MSRIKREIAGLDAAGRLLKRADVFGRLAHARERFGASGAAEREVARSDRAAAGRRSRDPQSYECVPDERGFCRRCGYSVYDRTRTIQNRRCQGEPQSSWPASVQRAVAEARTCVAGIPASSKRENWAVEARDHLRHAEGAAARRSYEQAVIAAANACEVVRERPIIAVPTRDLAKPPAARFMVQTIDQDTGKPTGKPEFSKRADMLESNADDPDVAEFVTGARPGAKQEFGGGAAPLVRITAMGGK